MLTGRRAKITREFTFEGTPHIIKKINEAARLAREERGKGKWPLFSYAVNQMLSVTLNRYSRIDFLYFNPTHTHITKKRISF